jgi:hypothetical protein
MPGVNDVARRDGPMAQGANLAWVRRLSSSAGKKLLGRWRDVTTRQSFYMGRHSMAVAVCDSFLGSTVTVPR